MALTANGSAFSFDSGALDVRAIRFTVGGAEIDVTNLASARKEFEKGLDDFQIEVDVVGHVAAGTVDVDDVGDVSYTPQGASAITVDDCIVMSKDMPAEVDGALITTIVFKPTTPVA